MRRHVGFTLVELLITITIMVILMTLAVFSLRSVQANARDEERETDISAIARGLEQRYVNGSPSSPPIRDVNENPITVPTNFKKGEYPSVNELRYAKGETIASYSPDHVKSYLTDLLPGTAIGTSANTVDTLTPPGSGSFDPICTSACSVETASVYNAATTISKYIYEPITSTNTLCLTTGCVRYNLYYRTEVDNVVHQVGSRHQ
jgi:prepilin-type N-terminal cleavage/methylation domain-containing protein